VRQNSRNQLNKVSAASSGFLRRVLSAQSRDFYILISLTAFLAVFGVFMVLSSSFIDALKTDNNAFSIFFKQSVSAVAGFVALSVVSLLRTSSIRKLMIPFAGFWVVVQLLVVFTPIGVSVNGNRNWIRLFGFTIQPSEFLKLAMILLVAQLIYSKRDELDDLKSSWLPVLLVSGGIMLTVLGGRDVGTVIVMALILVGMAVLAGLPRIVAIGVGLLGAVLVPLIMRSSESRWGRVMAWLFPDAPDPNDYNWQSTHGIWAFAAGGIGGVGLGQSKLKWSWIPEAENDFIFAIIGEEMGLIGALLVIVLIIYMAILFIRIAMKTTDLFKRLVVLGIMLWISVQSFVNIAVVLTLLPVLGVPLPLISAGGSSMLASLLAIGVVLAIERENHELGSTRRRVR
jgi:cell division protein FtsW